jgi:hypothetical protein
MHEKLGVSPFMTIELFHQYFHLVAQTDSSYILLLCLLSILFLSKTKKMFSVAPSVPLKLLTNAALVYGITAFARRGD